jgi:hypothetical protein
MQQHTPVEVADEHLIIAIGDDVPFRRRCVACDIASLSDNPDFLQSAALQSGQPIIGA